MHIILYVKKILFLLITNFNNNFMKKLKLFIAALALLGGVNLANAQTDVTSTYITNADFSSTDGWTSYVSSQYHSEGNGLIGSLKINNKNAATVDDTHLSTQYCFGFECRWSGNYSSYNQTTSLLPVGTYILSYDVQNTNSQTSNLTYNNLFYVQVGSTKTTDSKTEWMKGASSWTTHTIDFKITEASTAIISLGYGTGSNNTQSSNTPALYVSNLKLMYIPFATSEDYQNLNTAISAVESKAWGFDVGEYAPYNYVEVLAALAEAKAIDQNVNNSQVTIQGLTATLNGATWTANTEEVNAIWDPSFEHEYSTSGNVQPIAWTGTSGHNNATDVRWMWNVNSDAGLAATSSSKALFTKYGVFYGQQNGYTLPLNENTYYTIAFKYGGWSDCKKDGYVTVTDANNGAISLVPSENLPLDAVDGNSNTASWKNYTAIFKSNEAGNYVLGLRKKNETQQSQYVYGDFVLKTTTQAEAVSCYNSVLDEVNDDYEADVPGGTEKTNFKSAIDASIEDMTLAEIIEAAAELKTLHDTYVAAKPAYSKFYTEKARALSIGVQETDITIVPTLASEVQNALNALIVLEDATATANYTIDATDIFGAWTPQNTSTASGQHWSGDGRSYIDKYDNNGFTMSVTNTVALPAGDYVFKAAARAAAGGVWDDALTMQVTGQSNAIFNPQGDSGKGIDKSGAANYGEGTFANNNVGRGWEWRFIPFTLTAETEVTMKIEAIVKGGNWASFSDITLLTTSDNIDICRQMYEASKDAAETARDNTEYENVDGSEKKALTDAINAEVPDPATVTWYQSQKTALDNATEAFIAAKGDYDALATAISNANAIIQNAINVGDDVFQIPTSAKNTLETAANTASSTKSNTTTTAANAASAAETLNGAIEAFNAADLNAPASDVQYRIKSTAADAASWKDKYYVLKKDANQANGGYSTRAEGTDAAFWATAWKFTYVAGNTYKLSMIDADGVERYLCTNITGYGAGSATQIRTTTEEDNALVVKVIATTGTDGRWFLQNTEDNSYLGGQDAGLFSNSQNYDLAIEAAEKASVDVNIGEAVKYATRIFPFAPTLPEGVKAYTATVSDNKVTLEEVATPVANTPYILFASGGYNGDPLSGWGTASATSYESGVLTGVYVNTTPDDDTYVLANINNTVCFYQVDNDNKPTVTPYRCYLTDSSHSRVLLFDNEYTGIDAINALTSGEATIFNASGVKVPSLQKGMNIVRMKNGKTQKIMVK